MDLGALSRIWLTLASLTFATMAQAQSWTLDALDDGSFFSAQISGPQPGFTLLCGERSTQGLSAAVTGNMEPDVTPADAFRMNLSDRAIGPPGPSLDRRDDVLLVIGTSGYRLRGVWWNELFGTWEVDLPADDPALKAMAGEPLVELRSNAGSQLVKLDGFAPALTALGTHCAGMFAAIGQPWSGAGLPDGAPPQGAMRRAAENAIALGCNGAATRSPGTFLTGEIDGDGIEDVVLDWRAVACSTGQPYPYCGASQCAADIFLSSSFARRGQPYGLLGLGVWLQPLSNGNMAVAVGGSLGACSQRGKTDCRFLYYWNGYDIAPLN